VALRPTLSRGLPLSSDGSILAQAACQGCPGGRQDFPTEPKSVGSWPRDGREPIAQRGLATAGGAEHLHPMIRWDDIPERPAVAPVLWGACRSEAVLAQLQNLLKPPARLIARQLHRHRRKGLQRGGLRVVGQDVQVLGTAGLTRGHATRPGCRGGARPGRGYRGSSRNRRKMYGERVLTDYCTGYCRVKA
jgi:hypothetical protein